MVDDGSELSRVLLRHLGSRARRYVPRPATRPKPRPAARKPHPIQIVVDAVTAELRNLGIRSFEPAIARGDEPIVGYRGRLELAGDSSRLHAIANALHARSPWADLAVQALVAHAVAVLDDERTAINTETHQRVLETLLARGG